LPTKRNDEPSLLIPWSCRESFTAHVCGLPGNQQGCRRYRDTVADPKVKDSDKGIAPLGEPNANLIVAWIAFEIDVYNPGSPFSVKIYRGGPTYRPGHHQALFGFHKAGVAALVNGGDYYPVYLEFRAYNKVRGEQQNVTSWLSSDDEQGIGLSACFGNYTFTRRTPRADRCNIRCAQPVTIAALIDAYLDHQPQCRFRHRRVELQSRALGITTCKVEVALSKRKSNEQAASYLNSCDIAFSSLDPDTLTIKRIRDTHLGLIDPDIEPEIRDLAEQYFQPLHVAKNPDGMRREGINYAYCLSRYGRGEILPSEVGKSFLSFSAGEMCSYLLHWFLLRIFAFDHPLNEAFARAFQNWLHAVRSERRSQRACFQALLRAPVCLPVEPNVFKDEMRTLAGKSRYLGVYDEPTALGDALNTLGLGNANDAWLKQTTDFLLRFNRVFEDNPDQNLQLLPMFKALRWSDAMLLEQLDKATAEQGDCLEAIVHYLATGLSDEITEPRNAQRKVADLVRACVFPIAEALPHLSSSLDMPLYYIVPLWEDTIGQWQGPVIFAHVFTKALPFNPSVPSDAAILDLGTELQNLLVPIVSAIAHAKYNEEARKYVQIQHEAAEQKRLAVAAYKLGHPLKDRVGPLRAIINTLYRKLAKVPELKDLLKEINNAGDLLTRISQLGHILDMTSVAMMDKKGQAAFLKEGKENTWRVKDIYEVHAQVSKLSQLYKDPRAAKKLVLLEEDLVGLHDARIEPWIVDAQSECWRPGDLFYDEVISEVLTNAAKYGKRVEGQVQLRLGLEEVAGARCLVVSNECETVPKMEKLGLRLNEWRPWNTNEDGSIGGLFYIANSLAQTKSGGVYAKIDNRSGKCLFVVGLQLAGLVAGSPAPE
jgi:hypothetical protein